MDGSLVQISKRQLLVLIIVAASNDDIEGDESEFEFLRAARGFERLRALNYFLQLISFVFGR